MGSDKSIFNPQLTPKAVPERESKFSASQRPGSFNNRAPLGPEIKPGILDSANVNNTDEGETFLLAFSILFSK